MNWPVNCTVNWPVIRLALMLLAVLTAPLKAEPLSGQQISDLVHQALAEAGQGGTPVLSLHRGYPSCTTDPTITPSRAGWSAVDITCPDTQGWTRRVRISGGQPIARAPRPTATTPPLAPAILLVESLPKGTILTRAHLQTGDNRQHRAGRAHHRHHHRHRAPPQGQSGGRAGAAGPTSRSRLAGPRRQPRHHPDPGRRDHRRNGGHRAAIGPAGRGDPRVQRPQRARPACHRHGTQ